MIRVFCHLFRICFYPTLAMMSLPPAGRGCVPRGRGAYILDAVDVVIKSLEPICDISHKAGQWYGKEAKECHA